MSETCKGWLIAAITIGFTVVIGLLLFAVTETTEQRLFRELRARRIDPYMSRLIVQEYEKEQRARLQRLINGNW